MRDFFDESFPDIAIVGMGYVGSSLASVLADAGCRVHGIDVDESLVDLINDGSYPFEEERVAALFEEHVNGGRITATTNYGVIERIPVVIVTVGTPLAESDPDVTAAKAATKSIGPHITEGDTVIYRSTLPAGLTEGTIRPLLDELSGLLAGEEYSLAFCPERMAEGSAYADLTTLPVVVGGYTDSCRQRVEAFWEHFGQETVSVSSPTAAELTKLADNWWIDLNIALANEIALLSEKLGVDAMEVIRAANTLPKGDHNVNILYPGTGVGGSCLVKDPWFVANLGDKHGLNLRTPRISRAVNDRMPGHVVDLVRRGVGDLDGATVAVLGYAFKAGTDDIRNTPSATVVDQLLDAGADVRITDPFVSSTAIEDATGVAPSRLPDALNGADAVVIATDHDSYLSLSADDFAERSGSNDLVVVDGRFALDPAEFAESSVEYLGVGRGREMVEAESGRSSGEEDGASAPGEQGD